MGAALGDLLPLAVGVAISPIPIIGAILMLLGTHARTTSAGFATGWLAGIVIATTVFVFLGGTFDDSTSTTTAWIKLALGVLLLVVGLRRWRSRDEQSTPKWMAAIDDMRPVPALGLGFALAAVNPKNLMMCIAAGVTIGGASLPTGSNVVLVVVYSLLAATTVLIPVIAYQVSAQRLREPLARLKDWLSVHNAAVMATLIVVIGAVLIGKGITGLS